MNFTDLGKIYLIALFIWGVIAVIIYERLTRIQRKLIIELKNQLADRDKFINEIINGPTLSLQNKLDIQQQIKKQAEKR